MLVKVRKELEFCEHSLQCWESFLLVLPGFLSFIPTPGLRGALLIQDFQDIFGNLLQLMPRFVTLFADSVEKDCALITFMT